MTTVFQGFTSISEAGVHELADALGEGVTLVDVREPHEYAAGHVSGARLLPLGQVPGRLADLEAERKIYVICATGNRSEQATAFLASNGIDAVNVAGGMVAWMRAGNPVERGL